MCHISLIYPPPLVDKKQDSILTFSGTLLSSGSSSFILKSVVSLPVTWLLQLKNRTKFNHRATLLYTKTTTPKCLYGVSVNNLTNISALIIQIALLQLPSHKNKQYHLLASLNNGVFEWVLADLWLHEELSSVYSTFSLIFGKFFPLNFFFGPRK